MKSVHKCLPSHLGKKIRDDEDFVKSKLWLWAAGEVREELRRSQSSSSAKQHLDGNFGSAGSNSRGSTLG